MTSAAMRLIGDDRGRLPEERMERIGDDNLAAQNPGAMTSHRTAAAERAAVMYTLIQTAKTQRRRSASLARRRPPAHRRHPASARRVAALELAPLAQSVSALAA